SAVLMPFRPDGRPDYDAFQAHLERTLDAGLIPAVNMDTGYVHLLTPQERREVLALTSRLARGRPFVAGAFVEGESGDLVALYCRETDLIQAHGGMPILFQSTALISLPEAELVEVYRQVAARCERLLAFELGPMFAPFGAIYSLAVIEELMHIPQVVGIKHSSLRRDLEWQRLDLRDRVRPDFRIYTGNDLAIDMVIYGSDYLLGLSTFAPYEFARRDAYWAQGDPRFYELNDVLQFLGHFAFRPPVPAYRHSAAQFLQLRGWLTSDATPPGAPRRPDSDREVLAVILEKLESLV
ncbi:MAG: dihydrodipicolinate synthase family protein, partial [Anaerolineae bacterium]|nr:dihydrodipicolinate synthase family protein [Anaerolineae bacterium]